MQHAACTGSALQRRTNKTHPSSPFTIRRQTAHRVPPRLPRAAAAMNRNRHSGWLTERLAPRAPLRHVRAWVDRLARSPSTDREAFGSTIRAAIAVAIALILSLQAYCMAATQLLYGRARPKLCTWTRTSTSARSCSDARSVTSTPLLSMSAAAGKPSLRDIWRQ